MEAKGQVHAADDPSYQRFSRFQGWSASEYSFGCFVCCWEFCHSVVASAGNATPLVAAAWNSALLVAAAGNSTLLVVSAGNSAILVAFAGNSALLVPFL